MDALACRDQLLDPLGRQLHHEPAAHEHGEDLVLESQRRAAEPAAAAGRRHPVGADQAVDEVLVPVLWFAQVRDVVTHDARVGPAADKARATVIQGGGRAGRRIAMQFLRFFADS